MAAPPRVGWICRPGSTPGRGQFRSICRKAHGSACRRVPIPKRCRGARKTYGVSGDVRLAAAAGTQALIQLLPYLAAPGRSRSSDRPIANMHSPGATPAVRCSRSTISMHAPKARSTRSSSTPIIPMVASPIALRSTRLATQFGSRGGWLVIDEAFADIDPDVSAVALCSDLPVVILRSFGKVLWACRIAAGIRDRRA